MRTPLFVLVLSWLAICSFAQADIKGRITNQQQNITSATILLLATDSSLLKKVLTDQAGTFIFENVASGKYIISASVIGYTKFLSPVITLEEKNITLPDITLEEDAISLNSVIVKAKKPLYEQQADKLVVNVQSSITSSGNTVLEVLQKSPGVVVNRQNNSITMNGKSGVRIMINGKMLQLPLDVAMQMLDGMNASSVEKIELIHTPPAKYDAEGNAGIIHIITKGSTDLGTNGSFGLTVGYKWAETLGGNFDLNHRGKNFAWSLNYSIIRDHNLHISKMINQYPYNDFIQYDYNYSHRENITTQQNLSAGFEWKLNNNTSLSLLFTGYRRNWDMDAVTNDNNKIAKDSTIITDMKIHESNIWQSATGSIGFQTKLSAKSDLSFSVDYLYYHNNNPSGYDNKLFYEQLNVNEFQKINLQKKTPIRILIGKADYQYHPSPSLTWEAGVKGVTSNLDNDVSVTRLVNTVWITDPIFTSYSTLDEQIGAAYISTKWHAGKQWEINGGLRYEYTHTSLGTPVEKNLVNRKYGNLFPSFFLKKDLDKNKGVEFSYSRRITRPTYNDIAPFVFFWGPNTFSAGNTSLYPAIADAVKTGYHAKKWIIALQFTHSKNEIHFLQPEKDTQSNSIIYRSQNLQYLNTLALINTWSFKITPWWEVQTNLVGQYQVAKTSHLQHNTTLHLYGLNINVVNSLRLPKDFSIEVSGYYQTKTFFGISEYMPVGSLNAGIQKKMGEKGTLKLAMDDILHTDYWKFRTYLPENNLDAYFTYDFHNQYIRLTYTRKLGNNKLSAVKLKSGSEEERGRIGN